MSDPTTDDRLAGAAAQGDRAAFATLLERNYGRIYRLCLQCLREPDEAADLAQDVCAAMARKIKGFRGDSTFSTWSYRVILNATHDARRKHKLRRERTAEYLAEREDLQHVDERHAQRSQLLREAVEALPAPLRDTTILVIYGGLTHGEAAEVLKVKEGTISWRLSEVRKTLSRQLNTTEIRPKPSGGEVIA
ncbi:MAG: RNA polymerase sigma factor [Pseudomonadota bacterium]